MFRPVYEPRGKAREYCERALNLYTGCDHGCTYCYAPNVLHMTRDSFHTDVKVREGVLDALEKQCQRRELDGLKVLLCFTCDPYSPAAVKTGATRAALEILTAYDINFTVLTKGGTDVCADFDLYKPGDSFGTTLTFSSINDTFRWEPKSAAPASRVLAIQRAKDEGIKTWVSLEPVISPTDAKIFVSLHHSIVDLWKVGKWNYDPRAKNIDWNRFGHEIEELFIKYGCNYYIKEDLRKAMTGGSEG